MSESSIVQQRTFTQLTQPGQSTLLFRLSPREQTDPEARVELVRFIWGNRPKEELDAMVEHARTMPIDPAQGIEWMLTYRLIGLATPEQTDRAIDTLLRVLAAKDEGHLTEIRFDREQLGRTIDVMERLVGVLKHMEKGGLPKPR